MASRCLSSLRRITSITYRALIRFFLGLIEAIVTPGLTLLTARWYAQPEVPLRTLIWYSFNGWAGMFGDFVAYGVSTVTTHGQRLH